MLKSGEEILAELDATLDQLIINAQIVEKSTLYVLSEHEQEAFHKTQESLLAKFVHTNELLGHKQKETLRSKKKERYVAIQNKILHFLADQFQPAKKKQTKKPVIRRNRKLLKVR